MALNCAVLSYNGVTYFGFTGDAHAAPDLKRFERHLKASVAEMLKSAGHKRPTAQVTRRSEAQGETVKGGKVKVDAVVSMPAVKASAA
jgi:hypothetical protein